MSGNGRNRLSEYWSIFDSQTKVIWATILVYRRIFETHSAKPRYGQGRAFQANYRAILAPSYETDKSIITDLPIKLKTIHYTSLSANQAALYQNLVAETMSTIESSEGIERKDLY